MTDYPKFASITAKAMETVQERRTRARERGWVGDKKEEEEKNFCAHIIFKKWRIKCYLHHGGFFCRSPPDQPCRCRGTSHDMSGPIHQSCPRSKLGSEEDYYVGLQISLGESGGCF